MIELNRIYCGKCEHVLKDFPDNFFDSCVTDPPYGISFMNKHWDYQLPQVETWKEILRVLKPGAHILVACGTRTQHRMAVNIEDAGFEIRDVITWHYGSGFPKSLDISKAIDKMNGAEREVIGEYKYPDGSGKRIVTVGSNDYNTRGKNIKGGSLEITAPATEAAKEWEGYGTALKPATEFWTLARKPISENTIAENVLKHGTGGINIDGSRIDLQSGDDERLGGNGSWKTDKGAKNVYEGGYEGKDISSSPLGRFPANVIFDEFTGQLLDSQTGNLPSGGASRFFYCPKSDNYERNKGLNGFDEKQTNDGRNKLPDNAFQRGKSYRNNHHPTVKPIDLMRYLVKLITPKRGIVLDPFAGSGTTCIGAKLELINYVGIEMNDDYCKIAEARVAAWNPPKYIEQKIF